MTFNQKRTMLIVPVLLSVAHAEPPPLPPEKMWEYSDAIVVVDVLSVTNTGERGLQDETIYCVRMQVREVRKGALSIGHIMTWPMSNYQPPAGDYGGGVAFPGERLLYYLRRLPNGQYDTWGHNCCETLIEVPKSRRQLPMNKGETIYARRTSTSPGPSCFNACRNTTAGQRRCCRRLQFFARCPK